MTYVVVLKHSDGRTTYAGKDSWDNTEEPEAVFSLPSAKGKARHWKKISEAPGHAYTNLTSISIKPVHIEVGAECTEQFIPKQPGD